MKLIRKFSTNIVKCLFNDTDSVELTESYLKNGKIKYMDIKSTNAEIVENVPVESIPNPWINNAYTYTTEDGFTITDYGTTLLTSFNADKKEAVLQKLAALRYNKEIQGIDYTQNEETYTIATDRESVQLLDSYADKLRRGLITSVSWKCGNCKWLLIDINNIEAIEIAVLTHVQTCFAQEQALQLSINTDLDTDITVGWPI